MSYPQGCLFQTTEDIFSVLYTDAINLGFFYTVICLGFSPCFYLLCKEDFFSRNVKMRLEINATNLLFPMIPGTTFMPNTLGLSLIAHYTVN